MANDLNIESLSIEFQVTSQAALDSVDKLTEKLNKLKAATQGGLQGASSVAKSLEKIALAAKGFDSVDTGKLTATAEALNRLSNITMNGSLSGVASQMRDLTRIGNAVAGMPSISSGQLQTLTGLGSALSSLSNIPPLPDLSSTARSLTQLGNVASSITTVDMSAMAQKIKELTEALKPLESLGKTNLSSFINSLKRLPEVSTALSSMDMGTFAAQIQTVATAISPLTLQIQNMANAVGTLPRPMQNAIAGLMNYNNAAQDAENSTNGLLTKIKNLLSIGGIIAISRRIKSLFGGMIESSNAFVENINLFSVAMGGAADEALEFANRVNSLMGIDVSQWIQNQGYFKQIASGFGVVEEKANLMSKNLTQIGYDISSFYNISVESAMQKLQSGISGEIMPLRSLGYALDESTLKQVAYNHGITESITNMTQAQKSQIRYIAIMEQSKNAMGDMARTLESPANQMRIFEQRIDQLKRAIGNGLMPIISAALPWVTAFVKLLTEGTQKIADFLGFEIPEFNYGDLVAESNKGISSSFGDATKAAKEFKGTLSSIDQLNIIGGDKETSGKGIGDMYDLNIDLPSYDFLGGLEESTDKAYNSLKNFISNALPWLESFGTGIAVAFGATKIANFISTIGKLYAAIKNFIGLNGAKVFTGIAGGLASGATSGMLLFNGIKNLVTKTGDLANNFNLIKAGVGAAGIAISVFIAMGNPVGAVITGIVAALGALAGVIVGNIENMKAFDDALNNSITYASNGGARLSELTDGFKSYFSEITGHYDDILSNTKAFEDNESKISGAATEIQNLTEKYQTLGGSMTAEDAKTISDNIATIGESIKSNLGTFTKTTIDNLKTSFHDFAEQLGFDVDEMAGKFYLLESMGNASLASIKKEADELALKISESVEVDPTDLERLSELVGKMSTPDIGTKEQMGFNAMLEDMTSGRIQFESAEQAIGSINDFKVAAEQAKESINTAFRDQSYELEQMKARYVSLGADVEYDALYGPGAFEQLFSDYERIAKETQQSELNKIDMGVMAYVSMLESQLDKNASQYANTKIGEAGPGWGSGIKAFFTRGGLAMDDTAMYRQAMEDYSEEYRTLNADLYNAITDTLGELNLTPEAEKIGGYLIQGMANGAIKSTDDLYEALNAAASGGIDEVKRICGIASPSKVFYGIGEYLIEGLRLGVQSKESATLREFETFGKDINNSMVIAPLDWSVLTGEAPDFSKVYTPTNKYSYYTPSSEPTRTEGYDMTSVMEVAQLISSAQDGAPVEFTIYTNVELDGETVGEAVSRRQDYTMRLSNGR